MPKTQSTPKKALAEPSAKKDSPKKSSLSSKSKKKSTSKKALGKSASYNASSGLFPAQVTSVRATWIYPNDDTIEFYREHIGSLVQWNGTRFTCELRCTSLTEDEAFDLFVVKNGGQYHIKYDTVDGSTETNFARAFIGESEFVLCHESSSQIVYIHLSF